MERKSLSIESWGLGSLNLRVARRKSGVGGSRRHPKVILLARFRFPYLFLSGNGKLNSNLGRPWKPCAEKRANRRPIRYMPRPTTQSPPPFEQPSPWHSSFRRPTVLLASVTSWKTRLKVVVLRRSSSLTACSSSLSAYYSTLTTRSSPLATFSSSLAICSSSLTIHSS